MADESSDVISLDETVALLNTPRAIADWIMTETRKQGHDPDVVDAACNLVAQSFAVSRLKQLADEKKTG